MTTDTLTYPLIYLKKDLKFMITNNMVITSNTLILISEGGTCRSTNGKNIATNFKKPWDRLSKLF